MKNGNYISLNSSSKNLISDGENNIIGMAANLTKSIENSNVMIGNPAKILRINE